MSDPHKKQHSPLVKFIISILDIRIVRYLINGVCLFAIDFFVFYLFRRIIGIDIRLAKIISRIVSSSVGFFTHKYLVFRNKRNQPLHFSLQSIGFVTLLVTNMFISAGMVWFLEQIVKIPTLYFATFLTISNLLIINVITEGLMAVETFFVLKLIFHPWGKRKQNKQETE